MAQRKEDLNHTKRQSDPTPKRSRITMGTIMLAPILFTYEVTNILYCEFWTADLKMWNAIKGKINWVRYIGDYDSSNC